MGHLHKSKSMINLILLRKTLYGLKQGKASQYFHNPYKPVDIFTIFHKGGREKYFLVMWSSRYIG